MQGFQSLPSGGLGAEYVVNGMVVSGTVRSTIQAEGKSIAFKWSYSRGGKVFKVYATHKHTKEEGGSQDNQFADVKLFLDAALPCTDPSTLFLAICDGLYYERPHDGYASRHCELQADYGRRRVRACTIASLPSVLSEQLQAWLSFHALALTTDERLAFAVMNPQAQG